MNLFDIVIQWSVLGVAAGVLALRRQLTLYHPSTYYLLFHCIVFCVRPTLVWAADFDTVFRYMQMNPEADVLRTTLHVTSFALVVFVVAFSAACASAPLGDPGPRPEISPGMRRSFWLMCTVVTPLGFYSIFAQDFSGEHIRGVYILTKSTGYINDLQQVMVSLVVLFAFITRWRWYSFIPLLAFIYYRAGEGWARWMMIYCAIFAMLVYLWDKRRSLPPVWLLVSFLPLFVLFTNLTHDRAFIGRWMQGEKFVAPLLEKDELTFKDRYDTMDFANFDYLAFIIETVPEKTRGFNYGAQHLQLFTEPIPRMLWKGKPVGAPVSLIDWSPFGVTLGITYSVVGDGWISYGWLGVAVNMILYGFVLGSLYNWYIVHSGHQYRALIFLLLTSILLQVFRDGGFVTTAKFLLFTTLPIILWWVIHKVLFPDAIEENGPVKTL